MLKLYIVRPLCTGKPIARFHCRPNRLALKLAYHTFHLALFLIRRDVACRRPAAGRLAAQGRGSTCVRKFAYYRPTEIPLRHNVNT